MKSSGLFQLLSLMRPHRKMMVVWVILSMLSVFPDIMSPILFGKLSKYIFAYPTTHEGASVIWFSELIILNIVFNSTMKWIIDRANYLAEAQVGALYAQKLSTHILSLPQSWFVSQKPGKIISDISRGVTASREIVYRVFFVHPGQIFVLIGSMGYGLYHYGTVAIPLIGVVLCALYVSRIIDAKVLVQSAVKRAEATSVLYGTISDPIQCHDVVRDYHAVPHERNRIAAACHAWWTIVNKCSKTYAFWNGVSSLGSGILFGGTLVYGVWLFLHDALMAADVIYLNSLCYMTKGYVGSISRNVRETREYLADLNSVGVMFAVDKHVSHITTSDGDALTIRHVGFRYPDVETPILNDVSFSIKKGQSFGIVGESGAGKSTLLKLIQGTLHPTTGSVLVGSGVIAVSQTNTLFAHVQQDPVLFNRTLRENVCYPQERSHYEGRAGLDDFVKDLPQGWDTLVGDRGVRLSGGQRQRIAISRAIYNHASILILDEATSGLDSITEDLVSDILSQRDPDQILLVVAHRLKTVRDLDQILVLQHGRVIAQGTHSELIANCAYYRLLCEKQNAL